jgi:N-acetylmuramoyl-L-alanine amidase
MIGALALALQLSASVIAPVTGRAGDRATPLPVLANEDRVGVRADAVAAALGGVLHRAAGERYTLTVGSAAIELEPSLPIAKVDTIVIPLVSAPWLSGNALYIPLQVLSEVVPRFATGFMYEASLREVRVFTPVTGRAPVVTPAQRTETADATRVSERTPERDEPRRRVGSPRVVVVDAGHGGPDRGMTGPMGRRGPRIQEKHITLAVARLVAQELRNAGLTVVMTRTTDTLIALSDRGRIANRAKGDLFLSIHVNAAPTTWRNAAAGRGFETYFLAEAKTEDAKRVEQMENESVKFETGAYAPKGDPLSFIINDMAQNEHLRESNDLAESIQGEMRRVHPGPNRGVKQANFAVLRGSFMPAVLVEIGFGTNPEEASFISSQRGQRDLAAAISAGAVEYLTHYEQRVGSNR